MKKLKPGMLAPRSGEYAIVTATGKRGDERTVVRNEPLPPMPGKGGHFILVRPARNGAGRSK